MVQRPWAALSIKDMGPACNVVVKAMTKALHDSPDADDWGSIDTEGREEQRGMLVFDTGGGDTFSGNAKPPQRLSAVYFR